MESRRYTGNNNSPLPESDPTNADSPLCLPLFIGLLHSGKKGTLGASLANGGAYYGHRPPNTCAVSSLGKVKSSTSARTRSF